MPAADDLALYIHWPFCLKKCPYCDFNSHVREGVDQARWRRALLAEMAHVAARTGPRRLTSIFFGGGTPSLMPPATVAAVIEAAGRHWRFAEEVEITLEANPTSAEAGAFAGFAAAGVNRLSLGVQALADADLAFLGRQHSAAEALSFCAMMIDRGGGTVAETVAEPGAGAVDDPAGAAPDAGRPIAGFLARDGDEVHALYIRPEETGQGIGRLLLRDAMERSARLWLWTFQANLGAQKSYLREGFAEIRRTDGADNDENLPDIQYAWPAEAAA